jgi:hypothetical protein
LYDLPSFERDVGRQIEEGNVIFLSWEVWKIEWNVAQKVCAMDQIFDVRNAAFDGMKRRNDAIEGKVFMREIFLDFSWERRVFAVWKMVQNKHVWRAFF